MAGDAFFSSLSTLRDYRKHDEGRARRALGSK